MTIESSNPVLENQTNDRSLPNVLGTGDGQLALRDATHAMVLFGAKINTVVNLTDELTNISSAPIERDREKFLYLVKACRVALDELHDLACDLQEADTDEEKRDKPQFLDHYLSEWMGKKELPAIPAHLYSNMLDQCRAVARVLEVAIEHDAGLSDETVSGGAFALWTQAGVIKGISELAKIPTH